MNTKGTATYRLVVILAALALSGCFRSTLERDFSETDSWAHYDGWRHILLRGRVFDAASKAAVPSATVSAAYDWSTNPKIGGSWSGPDGVFEATCGVSCWWNAISDNGSCSWDPPLSDRTVAYGREEFTVAVEKEGYLAHLVLVPYGQDPDETEVDLGTIELRRPETLQTSDLVAPVNPRSSQPVSATSRIKLRCRVGEPDLGGTVRGAKVQCVLNQGTRFQRTVAAGLTGKHGSLDLDCDLAWDENTVWETPDPTSPMVPFLGITVVVRKEGYLTHYRRFAGLPTREGVLYTDFIELWPLDKLQNGKPRHSEMRGW